MDQRGPRKCSPRATEPFDNKEVRKFSIAGPDIRIASGAVIAFAMTLNELCTNTTKFGALSVPAGRVDIAWTLDQQTQRLNFTWTEKNGPSCSTSCKAELRHATDCVTRQTTQGRRPVNLRAGGFVYALDVPVASVTSSAA